jgi:putative acetyltransferase
MACEIAIEDPRQPELLALLADDDAHYAALYPAESNHLLDAAVLAAADVTFLVARVSHARRVWRAAPARCRVRRDQADVCRACDARPEAGAASERAGGARPLRWATCLRLETGTKQPKAILLYRLAGYSEIPPFGDYKPDPLSIFMERRLA